LLPRRAFQANYAAAFEEIAKEELNVKQVTLGSSDAASEASQRIELDMEVTPELKREGLVREVIRNVQNARKQAGLQVDDRIRLALLTNNSQLRQAIDQHQDLIKAETLAVAVDGEQLPDAFTQESKVEGEQLKIALVRVDSAG
jgi:isoleucyl-tRNA synthetase